MNCSTAKYQLILHERVAVEQKGIAGIGVDNELIDFTMPEIVLHLHFVERLPEAPMVEAGRHAISTEGINDI